MDDLPFLPEQVRRDLHRLEHMVRRPDVMVPLPQQMPGTDAVRALLRQALGERRQSAADSLARAQRATTFATVDPTCAMCGTGAVQFREMHAQDLAAAGAIESLLG